MGASLPFLPQLFGLWILEYNLYKVHSMTFILALSSEIEYNMNNFSTRLLQKKGVHDA